MIPFCFRCPPVLVAALISIMPVAQQLLRPAPADLAAGRDPVLARAAAILGAALDPAAAGKLFPTEWR